MSDMKCSVVTRMIVVLGLVAAFGFGSSARATVSYNDGATHTIGGGPLDNIIVSNATTVNLLAGSTILGDGDSQTGGSGNVIGETAVRAYNASTVGIADGSYTGGTAHADGGFLGNIVGGDGMSILTNSSGTIHDGTFTGGAATADNWTGNTVGGDGLNVLDGSEVSIYNGVFTGGSATAQNGFGNTVGGDGLNVFDSTVWFYGGLLQGGAASRPSGDGPVRDGHALGLFTGVVWIFGGETIGGITLFDSSELVIVGNDLAYDSGVLSGVYGNGDRFSHTVTLDDADSRITFRSPVPEPTTGALCLLSLLGLSGIAMRRPSV